MTEKNDGESIPNSELANEQILGMIAAANEDLLKAASHHEKEVLRRRLQFLENMLEGVRVGFHLRVKLHGDVHLTNRENEVLGFIAGSRAAKAHARARRESSKRLSRLLRFIEVASRILPAKVRGEAFEPAYHEAKADFLRDRRRFKPRSQRVWLGLCFGLHVLLLLLQTAWGMCGDRVKRLVLHFLPDLFKRFLS